MIILSIVFIVMSCIIAAQFILAPVILFILHIHHSIQEGLYGIDNVRGDKNSNISQESAERSLKLLKSQLTRLGGPNDLYYKRGKLIVVLKYPSDVNIDAVKRHLRYRGIMNFKVK